MRWISGLPSLGGRAGGLMVFTIVCSNRADEDLIEIWIEIVRVFHGHREVAPSFVF